jgi:hypothetical protein
MTEASAQSCHKQRSRKRGDSKWLTLYPENGIIVVANQRGKSKGQKKQILSVVIH